MKLVLNDPALTFTIALAAGITVQSAARHLQVPGIILLLLVGTLLGPDVANVVRPDTLGGALDILVGLSVAVILFEGGLSLSVARLRREARAIRLLITLGALVTALGAAVAATWLMGWPRPIAITFGALVVVTGPTVITPLLRRVRVQKNVSTILEAEGVLIDPIGAILAVVALEWALAETTGGATRGLLSFPSRLLVGAAVGVVGGGLLALTLRLRRLIPEGLESVFTLSLVLLLYQVSNALQHESGVMEAAVAGLMVGNVGPPVPRELREFKEQMTVLLVGLLFVLLAADVRLSSITSLGWGALAVVLALMLVIRPVAVALSTWGSGLTWRERAFIAWIGPRGIVAAAVASVFAERLVNAGYPAGEEFRALVFLVIAVTVVVQGVTSGPAASLLGVRRRNNDGHVIVGANPLGRALARVLVDAGEDVVLIDSNEAEVRAAVRAGFTALHGNAMDEDVLERADAEGRRSFTAVTANDSANLLLARTVKEHYKVPETLAALHAGGEIGSPAPGGMGRVDTLAGSEFDVADWIHAFRYQEAEVRRYRLRAAASEAGIGLAGDWPALPLALIRRGAAAPVGHRTRVKPGDLVAFAIRTELAEIEALPPGDWERADDEGAKPADEAGAVVI